MARHNQKGRSKGGGAFVQLHHFMMKTAAWRTLNPSDRAVYIEVVALYNGKNNGFLALGVRDAAERCNINKDTAARCFKRLALLGFIERAQAGKFSQNSCLATEWRLTQYKCDRTGALPSKAFLRPGAAAEASPLVSDSLSPQTGQQHRKSIRTVPPFRTVEAA